MILEGIDVSSYQGHVNWQAVKYAGKKWASCKATEGLHYGDDTFEANWSGMALEGLPRIAYHFFYDDIDPIAQVKFNHAWVRNHGRYHYGDALMVDVERFGIREPQHTIERLVQFVERAWYEIDKPVIIYTGYDPWIDMLGNPTNTVLAKCPLWIASYGPNSAALANWPNGLSFWQYSEHGHCPGISGEVDLDRFYGTEQQLHAILHVVPAH